MDDIPVSARTQAAARRWALDLGIEPEKVKTRTPRFTAETLSDEDAALHIQVFGVLVKQESYYVK